MKKFIFCISLVLTGLMTACIDKNTAVDEENKPSWLGESIYQELKSPVNLEGTFNTYLRLVDDLGYSEVLNRTGSKTVFPANDEAFQRFFQSNKWGVTSYEQLSIAQKKMLLYSSMLDNALLISMLSNVSNTSSEESTVSRGVAMKHQTSLNIVDTIQVLTSGDEMPHNNKYWDKYRNSGNMYIVSDATRPMMVHFTREHMLSNDIKVTGDVNKDNDFAILTGTEYEDGMAYIFDDQIIKSDVTCQNGYIHQMKDVIVPPGNMAQMLREDNETSYISHVLDYFCAPFENQAVTNIYNAAVDASQQVDKIYEVRYLNSKSNHRQSTDPDGNIVSGSYLLNFDPGWNQYSPSGVSGGVDYTIADVAALFMPTNEAMKKFFLEGGDGAYLIDLYGKYQNEQNTEEHLAENLDSLHSKKPQILTAFLNNLMKPSFINTVPSKFEGMLNDANEYMGVTTDLINKKSDGTYDIRIANNGVIYKMNTLIAPDEYQSVMAPSSVYPDMQVINWAVKEPDANQKLNIDFRYYLMAMSSKFAFFIPDDEAFNKLYIDPVSLAKDAPRAFKFYYDEVNSRATLYCQAYHYDPKTNTIGDIMNNGQLINFAEWKSQLVDILNYHTVVLDKDEKIGDNKYYKTKHGGEIYITGGNTGDKVMSGQQIDNDVTPAQITKIYNQKNGTAYRINHVIESPRNSVSRILKQNSQFSEFYDLCAGFSANDLLAWAGISNDAGQMGTSEQDAYIIFTTDRGSGSTKVGNSSLDELGNVKMFNTYNYTLYVPNNNAMKAAYAAGLPRWKDVNDLMEQYPDESDQSAAATAAREKAKKMIDKMRSFARYHFQSTSVYADNKVESNRYNSLSTDALGLALELQVSGGDGKIHVKDGAGKTHTIDANDSSKKSNLMARDYWFDATRRLATSIYTSSFCVIHELSEALDSGQD